MIDIKYLGVPLNNSKRFKMEHDNDFGYKVRVVYKDATPHGLKEQIFNNCTTIDYLFPNNWNHNRIELDSQIHNQGSDRLIDDIELIEITNNIKKEEVAIEEIPKEKTLENDETEE